MTSRPIHERLLGGLLSAVSLAALVVPAGIWWHLHRSPRDVARQHDVDIPALGDRELATYRTVARSAAGDAPLILAYHDIRPRTGGRRDPYTVTPQEFAAQMTMLRESGFRTISSADLQRWLDGGDLPPRAAMVTFDDGPSGLWRYADPVLADLGLHAVAFVITGAVGHHRPYYLSWNELDRMRSSGRWDIESHTRNGHGLVPTSAAGDEHPFLINRAWLPHQRRLETMGEFTRRVRSDIAGSKADLARHDFDRPSLFAFPFSAEVSPTNDPRAPELVSQLVGSEFAAAMTNSEPASWVTERDRHRRVLPRVEVFAGMSPRALFERIAHAAPIAPRRLAPLRMPTLWVDSAGRAFDVAAVRGTTTPVSPAADAVRFEKGAARIVPSAGSWLGAFFAPGRLADWSSYTSSVTMAELGDGRAGGLLVHVGDDAAISVSVSSGYVSVRRRSDGKDAQLAGVRVPNRAVHRVSVTLSSGALTVRVDGRVIVRNAAQPASSGTIGLSSTAPKSGAGHGVVFRDLVIDGRRATA